MIDEILKKAENNQNEREKIRQTLNCNKNFKKIENTWILSLK